MHYSLGTKKGDLVSVGAGVAAEPLVVACFREILRAGAHPWVRMAPDGSLGRAFFEEASNAQLKHVNPIDLYAMKKIDARLTIMAPQNTKALSNVDPKKQAIASQARRFSLLTAPPADLANDALLRTFGEARVAATPYAYAVDITGEATLDLIEADP